MANKQYCFRVWVDGRWLTRVWSDADVRSHVDRAVEERARLFTLKHASFSVDLSAKMCADALRKLRGRLCMFSFGCKSYKKLNK